YYNYRHFNPTDGRWISRDLLGESNSTYNLYNYCMNAPVIYSDRLGLYVVLCFAYDTRKIIGFDHVNPSRRIEIDGVFSGNNESTNNPDDQCKTDRGPLPEGVYWIGKEYIPDNHNANHRWFKLFGQDGKGGMRNEEVAIMDSDTGEFKRDSKGKLLTRGGFNLHAGLRSNGCLTVPSDVPEYSENYPYSKKFNELKEMINSSRRKEPFRNPRKETDTFGGILFVTKCEENCATLWASYTSRNTVPAQGNLLQ
ncbi:MAG: DUF2778 domain-containing protein, partial [Akkermansiaceae bacterium]|nr:DUF2778 domain-containing protein [Akkermansiaceae bacterium]